MAEDNYEQEAIPQPNIIYSDNFLTNCPYSIHIDVTLLQRTAAELGYDPSHWSNVTIELLYNAPPREDTLSGIVGQAGIMFFNDTKTGDILPGRVLWLDIGCIEQSNALDSAFPLEKSLNDSFYHELKHLCDFDKLTNIKQRILDANQGKVASSLLDSKEILNQIQSAQLTMLILAIIIQVFNPSLEFLELAISLGISAPVFTALAYRKARRSNNPQREYYLRPSEIGARNFAEEQLQTGNSIITISPRI